MEQTSAASSSSQQQETSAAERALAAQHRGVAFKAKRERWQVSMESREEDVPDNANTADSANAKTSAFRYTR